MLQINYIREQKDAVITGLAIKNFDGQAIIEQVIQLDNDRRKTQQELDGLLNEANTIAKEVGDLFKSGKADQANELKSKSVSLKEKTKILQESLQGKESDLTKLLLQIPNVPHESVPKGKEPKDNITVHQEGVLPKLHASAKAHWELTTQYDIIDFELGVKLTGAGFPVYKGKGAKLQRALINFFLDQATAAGYLEVQPPIMVNEASAYGTGQLPDKEGQMYHVGLDNLYLSPPLF